MAAHWSENFPSPFACFATAAFGGSQVRLNLVAWIGGLDVDLNPSESL